MVTTPDNFRHLTEVSDPMLLAIDTLVSGGTQIDAAQAATVTRQTVSGWVRHHPGFKAQLNSRRRELLAERADRIRDLDAQALSVVANAVGQGNESASLAWLKMRRVHEVDVARVGAGDAGEIIQAAAAAIRARPEHADILTSVREEELYGITREDAVALAKREIHQKLDTSK